jgi:magnesium-protoporphyrin O-methyltransferase
MNCSQCQGIEETFSREYVAGELKRYRRKGPPKTTQMLVEALKRQGLKDLTLLDIGGGVGAIQHALLGDGVVTATDVDASAAYLEAAREEATRRGLADRVRYEHGNFVEVAERLDPADVVTLDRVICCYDDMRSLVDASSRLASRFYGVVYPRDTWWLRLALAIGNFFLRLQKNPYQAFAHPTREVESLVHANGLRRRFYRQTFAWQVAVFCR